MTTIKQANKLMKTEGVQWVQGQFADLQGGLRSFTSPAVEYTGGDLWKNGISFDGSSVGLSDIDDSDMNLVPDPSTFCVIPWTEGVQKAARVIVDLKTTDDWSPCPSDPRHIARRADDAVEEAGFSRADISPELEFFMFRSIDHAVTENDLWTPLSPSGHGHIRVLPELLEDFQQPIYLSKPHSGYFQAPPNDTTDAFRNEFARVLLEMDNV